MNTCRAEQLVQKKKQNKKEAKPKQLASEGLPYPYLGKVCPNFTTDVIQARTNEKITIFTAICDGCVIERRQTMHNKSITLALHHKN